MWLMVRQPLIDNTINWLMSANEYSDGMVVPSPDDNGDSEEVPPWDVNGAGVAEAQNMYWIDLRGIHRARSDGGSTETIIPLNLRKPFGIAVREGKIYWTEHIDNKIQRANVDGTDIEDLVTMEALSLQRCLAIDIAGGKIYCTNVNNNSKEGKIQRANLDGTDLETIVTGVKYPIGTSVDEVRGKIYWTSFEQGKIQRANLDGTTVETLIHGTKPEGCIVVDSARSKIYWTSFEEGKIQRANLDGTNVEDVVKGLNTPIGISVDASGGKIYWTSSEERKIQRANLDGTAIETIVTGVRNFITSISVEAVRKKIYWT